jgi:carbon-monoxide dehydrogenase iron sulfur subunit
LRLGLEPLKCVACGLCETVCSLNRDSVLTPMGSSIILHLEDRANYFGLVLKTQDDGLVVARPEGKTQEDLGGGSSGPGAKPILLREPCDLCGGDPKCAKVCPTGCIKVVD